MTMMDDGMGEETAPRQDSGGDRATPYRAVATVHDAGRPTRIVVSADWHVGDRMTDEVAQRLLLAMAAAEPDLVLVLGDFAAWHQPDRLAQLFDALARLPCPVGVVFGNHDIWIARADGPADSWAALAAFCALARRAGVHPLDEAPLQVGDLFICGTGGWYDYSFGNPHWTHLYPIKRFGGIVLQDGDYARWGLADPIVSARLCAALDAQLALAPAGSTVVAATHVAALPGSVPHAGRPSSDFFNAYWGSSELGAILGRRRVALHIHGHIHADDRPISIPEAALDRRSGLASYNACWYAHRPFLLCERVAGGGWSVSSG